MKLEEVGEQQAVVSPSASRLTESLRDIGYDLPTAIADLVDNSVSAGAKTVDVIFRHHKEGSFILVADDGCGMDAQEILEALRFGSRRTYGPTDLGRFGLGLKTASLSLGRRLTVVSRAVGSGKPVGRTLDLDWVAEHDEWIVPHPEETRGVEAAFGIVAQRPGTVVVVEKLDRVLGRLVTESASKKRLTFVAKKLQEHLSMVFHRFLAGETGLPSLAINVDDGTMEPEKLAPWDPFARDEESTNELPTMTLPVRTGGGESEVRLWRFVLPARSQFSSPEAFERLSGPLKWNRQQGIYVYRAGRLIQYGGWARLRAIDEHTKLARAAIDFPPELDRHFQTNVSKMSVNLPTDIRAMLRDPVQELALKAAARYRLKGDGKRRTNGQARSTAVSRDVGFALHVAADLSGDSAALQRMMERVKQVDPALWCSLGGDLLGNE